METALLKVISDTLLSLVLGNLAILTLLDLSAAFDSVDHEMLLRHLQTSCGMAGSVPDWFRSYLSGRVQHIRSTMSSSTASKLLYGVPQGSVLEIQSCSSSALLIFCS